MCVMDRTYTIKKGWVLSMRRRTTLNYYQVNPWLLVLSRSESDVLSIKKFVGFSFKMLLMLASPSWLTLVNIAWSLVSIFQQGIFFYFILLLFNQSSDFLPSSPTTPTCLPWHHSYPSIGIHFCSWCSSLTNPEFIEN